MCCFTQPVSGVADTCIFARAAGERQVLVYSMTYAAQSDLAMVLPIPVVPDSADDALRFIDLQTCPDFFEHLRDCFPKPVGRLSGSGDVEMLSLDERPTLAVVDVGQFEASFVPKPEDFARLDERFRLPADLWLQLNTYRDWGFAVFKLRAAASPAHVHPMAFDFPRRDRQRLFFPTLHIHQRSLEPKAWFDHEIYCQPDPAQNEHLAGWHASAGPVEPFMQCAVARTLVDVHAAVWRVKLYGTLENVDTWLGPGGRIPVSFAGTPKQVAARKLVMEATELQASGARSDAFARLKEAAALGSTDAARWSYLHEVAERSDFMRKWLDLHPAPFSGKPGPFMRAGAAYETGSADGATDLGVAIRLYEMGTNVSSGSRGAADKPDAEFCRTVARWFRTWTDRSDAALRGRGLRWLERAIAEGDANALRDWFVAVTADVAAPEVDPDAALEQAKRYLAAEHDRAQRDSLSSGLNRLSQVVQALLQEPTAGNRERAAAWSRTLLLFESADARDSSGQLASVTPARRE